MSDSEPEADADTDADVDVDNGGDAADEDAICRIAMEKAAEAGLDKCNSEQALMDQTARLVGLSETDIDCDTVLSSGPKESDHRQVRKWVICRVHDGLLDEHGNNLLAAIDAAWEEAEQKMGEALLDDGEEDLESSEPAVGVTEDDTEPADAGIGSGLDAEEDADAEAVGADAPADDEMAEDPTPDDTPDPADAGTQTAAPAPSPDE